MAYLALSSIVGCISPQTGTTTAYDIKYNLDKIVAYMKKDIKKNSNNGFIDEFVISITFENYTQLLKFENMEDRDNCYDNLPD